MHYRDAGAGGAYMTYRGYGMLTLNRACKYNKSNMTNSFQSKYRAISLLVLAGIVGVWGVAALVSTSATSYVVEAQLESGLASEEASAVAISGASAGRAVRFGNANQTVNDVRVFGFRMFGGTDDPSRIGTANIPKYQVYLLSPYMKATAAAIKQHNPGAKVYMYKDPTSTRTTAGCVANALGRDWGVDYCDAAANHAHWFMTKSGQRFEYNGYGGHWHLNVAAAGYKERYTSNVLQDLRQSDAWDGVFLDNMMADIRSYVPGNVFPDQYTTQSGAQSAYANFMNYVGSQLLTAGYGTMGNNNGARLVPGLWGAYTAGATGGYDEFWTTFGGTASTPNNLPLYDNVGWEAQLAEADLLSSQNKLGVFTAQTNRGACKECQMYGYASYLLVADGRQAYVEGNVDGEVGNWLTYAPIYGWNLGQPLAPRQQVQTNLFQRNFAKGTVLVHAGSSGAKTVNLPKTYINESGQSVTTVTVEALRGRILRLP